MIQKLGVIMATAYLFPALATAQPVNVRDFAPKDGADWAPAFAAAYNAVVAKGGGEILIPSGRYPMSSSPQGDQSAHIVIAASNIAFVGEARRTRETAPGERGEGTLIYSTTSDKAIFRIDGPSPAITVRGIVFRDLKISRECREPAKDSAVGILFDDSHGKDDAPNFVWDTALDHVTLSKHMDGLRGARNVRPHGIELDGCRVYENVRHGVLLARWGSVHATSSVFYKNGGDGMALESSASTSPAGYSGTANLSACEFFANGASGLRIETRAEPAVGKGGTPADAHDIHIASTQFDMNGLSGVRAIGVNNFNMAASSITASGQACGAKPDDDACLSAGLELRRCNAVSVAAVTIEGGRAGGLVLRDCSEVSLGSCSITWNNNRKEGGSYAVVISAGSDITITGCTLGGSPQTLGVWMDRSPQNLVISALNFRPGMTTLFGFPDGRGEDGIAHATGHIQYWRPASEGAARTPGEMVERAANAPK